MQRRILFVNLNYSKNLRILTSALSTNKKANYHHEKRALAVNCKLKSAEINDAPDIFIAAPINCTFGDLSLC
jgi:hypothetical protein